MQHAGYFTDKVGGQPVYRCVTCQFDTFNLRQVREHVQTHRPIEIGDPLSFTPNFDGKRVVLSLLTWNHGHVGADAALSLSKEAASLERNGAECKVVWVDNGSTDWVFPAKLTGTLQLIQNKENLGISKARNQVLDAIAGWNADYWIMVDGDIRMIAGSGVRLTDAAITGRTISVGCIGMYSVNCSPDKWDADVYCGEIRPEYWKSDPAIAWTQYGIFDMRPFKEFGMLFEDRGAFGEPGWGFEDDDMYLQLLSNGFTSVYCNLYRYLHRAKRSSIAHLGPSLAAKQFEARKSLILKKWGNSSDRRISNHIRAIANQHMPML